MVVVLALLVGTALFPNTASAQTTVFLPHTPLVNPWSLKVAFSNPWAWTAFGNNILFMSTQASKGIQGLDILVQEIDASGLPIGPAVMARKPNNDPDLPANDPAQASFGIDLAPESTRIFVFSGADIPGIWAEVSTGSTWVTYKASWVDDGSTELPVPPTVLAFPKQPAGWSGSVSSETAIAICSPNFPGFPDTEVTVTLKDLSGRSLAQGTVSVRGGDQTAFYLGQLFDVVPAKKAVLVFSTTTDSIAVQVVNF
jgi:hypothetical protein